jgi:hypothetical protein
VMAAANIEKEHQGSRSSESNDSIEKKTRSIHSPNEMCRRSNECIFDENYTSAVLDRPTD